MGNGKTLLRRSEKSGEGTVGWDGELKTFDVYDPREKEHAYGFLREISRLKVSNIDANGRPISDALKKGDKDTARNLLNQHAEKNGFVPSYVYHGTLSDGRLIPLEERFNTLKNDIRYALDEDGMWEMEHIFEDDDPEGEIAMTQVEEVS